MAGPDRLVLTSDEGRIAREAFVRTVIRHCVESAFPATVVTRGLVETTETKAAVLIVPLMALLAEQCGFAMAQVEQWAEEEGRAAMLQETTGRLN